MKLLTRDHLLTILQTRTQREAAKYLGIGERTIRRIKNEPNHKTTKRVAKAVQAKGVRERKKLRQPTFKELLDKARQSLKRRGIKAKLPDKPAGRWEYDIPDLPIVPPSVRETRLDPKDKDWRTRMWSDVISFDVRKLSIDDIKKLIIYYRDKGFGEYSIQIIYRRDPYPDENKNKTYHAALEWEAVSGKKGAGMQTKWSDSRINRWLIKARNGLRPNMKGKYRQNILYVQVQTIK